MSLARQVQTGQVNDAMLPAGMVTAAARGSPVETSRSLKVVAASPALSTTLMTVVASGEMNDVATSGTVVGCDWFIRKERTTL